MTDNIKLLLLVTGIGILGPLAIFTAATAEPELTTVSSEDPSLAQMVTEAEESVERLQEELRADVKFDETKVQTILEKRFAESLDLGAPSKYEVPELTIVALRARASLQRCIQLSARIDRFLKVHGKRLDDMKLERIRRFGRERMNDDDHEQTITEHHLGDHQ